jgi:hypothetical protein
MMALRGYMANEGLAEGMFQFEACPGGMLLMSGDDAKLDKPPWSSTNYGSEALGVLLGFTYIGFIIAVSL